MTAVVIYTSYIIVIRRPSLEGKNLHTSDLLLATDAGSLDDGTQELLTVRPIPHAEAMKQTVERLRKLGLDENDDFVAFVVPPPGLIPSWVTMYAYRQPCETAVAVNRHYGIVIRQDALHRTGASRSTLLSQMETDQPFAEDESLVSFGPHFGGEAANTFVSRLETLGLENFVDMFVYADDVPDWLAIGATLSVGMGAS